jgi:dihydropyrimidinase
VSKVIRNGTIVTADRTWKADVLVEGERIAAIGEALTGDDEVDATDAFVIPGGIDPHTHLEMPFMGTTAAETFESGTFAAASGGPTMLVDFVLPGPDGSLLTAVRDWDRKSAPQICVDIGYHVAVTGWNETIWREMAEVVKLGVNTFKHFMAYKGALMVDDDELYASFRRCAELGALPLVHAENGDIVAELQKKYMEEGVTGPEGHAYSRPPEVEGEAANRAIMIADAAGVPLYIVQGAGNNGRATLPFRRSRGRFGAAAQTGPEPILGCCCGGAVEDNIFGAGGVGGADGAAVDAGCFDAGEETAVKPFVPALYCCVTLFVIKFHSNKDT